jgi:hypothetical protein
VLICIFLWFVHRMGRFVNHVLNNLLFERDWLSIYYVQGRHLLLFWFLLCKLI